MANPFAHVSEAAPDNRDPHEAEHSNSIHTPQAPEPNGLVQCAAQVVPDAPHPAPRRARGGESRTPGSKRRG